MIQQITAILGSRAAQARLRDIRKKSPDAFAGGVYLAASDILTTAMRLVPVDTGWLRKSRFLRRPVVSGAKFSFSMGFGASYALYVHEIWKQYAVGEWKYLQTAINWHEPRFIDTVSVHAWRLLSQGLGLSSVPVTHPVDPPADDSGRPKSKAHTKANRKKRAKSRVRNEARMARESRASLDAQRSGRQAPRPGR